jgi:hypothetical protein
MTNDESRLNPAVEVGEQRGNLPSLSLQQRKSREIEEPLAGRIMPLSRRSDDQMLPAAKGFFSRMGLFPALVILNVPLTMARNDERRYKWSIPNDLDKNLG